jgi:uncharacterized protein YprB with RNaseH-like and TPR domain
MALEDSLGGRVREYRGGRFYSVERALSEVDSGKMGGYIMQHKDMLLLRNIRRRFQELEQIPKEKMLFFDIETCGFGPENSIISIALAHVHHKYEVQLECLLARDYREERTIIDYFLSLLPHYEAFFSYNGKSFDAPRIESRAIQNGLFGGKSKFLRALFNGSHHDLFLIGKENRRLSLSDGELKTAEEFCFNYIRQNDIPSEQIPQVYFEFVYGRKRESKKVRADEGLWQACKKEAEQLGEMFQAQKDAKKDGQPSLPLSEDLTLPLGSEQNRSYAAHLYEQRGGTFRDVYSPGDMIDEAERADDMRRLINHTFHDVITPMAILCYLCGPSENLADMGAGMPEQLELLRQTQAQDSAGDKAKDSDTVPF